MNNFGKWIAGGLGWAFFGPLGGILGFALGSMLDKDNTLTEDSVSRTTTGGFVMSLLVLVSAMMKADGKVLKSELEYVKAFFIQSFGVSSAKDAINMLRDLLKQTIPVIDVCRQIRRNMDYSTRLQLFHFLYGVANSDNHISQAEKELLNTIAISLGINAKDMESIQSMFIPNTDAAYKILEIEPTATVEDIKKAYRTMARKYHPDKVAYLGEDFQQTAKEKFQKVNEAYEQIKKERNI